MTTTAADTESSDYNASSIRLLTGLDPVRKRPGMYIGGTGTDGLHHLIWEIVDNGVDEAAAGHADRLELTLHDDGSVEFFDNGRGIPVDVEQTTGRSAVELVFCELHAGGKFGGGGYATAGGLHGVGASVVNALSSRLEVTVSRDGHEWSMGFRQDTIGTWSAAGKFSEAPGIRKGKKTSSTGTRVRFWPDRDIFDPEAVFDLSTIVERARQVTYLTPGVSFVVDDRRPDGERFELSSTEGIGDLVEHLSVGDPLCPIIRLTGTGTYTERIPVPTDDGGLETRDVEREMGVDIALRWVNGWDPAQRSFVNTIVTPKGGTHVAGFERALTRTLNTVLRDTKTLKDKEDNVVKDDVIEGIVSVVKVQIAEPQFEGQTKEVLGTPAASSIVYQIASDQLKDWFNRNAKRAAGKAVLTKVATSSRARVAARQQRDTARRKSALESSSMPAKLADCRTKDVARSELMIIEGDSAAGSAKAARDSEFQALLPIRGKILNAAKSSAKAVMDNAECAALITAIGAGSGRNFDLASARYGRVLIMADADVDGSHIRTLLLTFFYHWMRPLLEAGRVYSAIPPLYSIPFGKELRYAYSDAERDEILAEIRAAGGKKVDFNRYKGLGEMEADELAITTMDVATRRLRRVTLRDAEAAASMFDTLMGSAVEPRRRYIVEHSELYDRSQLDI